MTTAAKPSLAHEALSKAPPAILMFWVVKICATTVGETGGDAFSMSLKLGYLVATLIFLAFFAVTLTWQVASKRYHPLTYWLVVVATTTVGTTTSDFIDRTLHAGYVLSSSVLLALVIAVLVAWRLTTGRIAADRITTRTDEIFYWLTILVSNTLGTALGDFSSETIPDLMEKIAPAFMHGAPAGGWDAWGFELAAVVFAALIGLVAVLHLMKWAPQAVLFWAAYVLTRPLGATLGDTLTKPHAQGGLDFGRFLATGVIALAMVVLILLAPRLRRPAEVSAATVPASGA
ncbi:hypothetical protein [Phenylobacterium sp.]|jgi:uncharacterized membrane-anchored protein|uniref:COG4705 family protein n=1 Tax=Phenylobacterium sp. TaxID=1871053 RepID=UPI00121C19B8|nr:hypothetical protein [Phenylobacterium sp.]THD58471.1 MAG: hypothetical protein E8A12_12465 [Phenylobacterium sp.]